MVMSQTKNDMATKTPATNTNEIRKTKNGNKITIKNSNEIAVIVHTTANAMRMTEGAFEI